MAVAFFLAFASQLPVLRGMSKEVESIIVCFNNRDDPESTTIVVFSCPLFLLLLLLLLLLPSGLILDCSLFTSTASKIIGGELLQGNGFKTFNCVIFGR